MTAFINRVGQEFNGIVVIEELKDNKVRGLCTHCGNDKKIYYKHRLISCVYTSCGCIRHSNFIDRTCKHCKIRQ